MLTISAHDLRLTRTLAKKFCNIRRRACPLTLIVRHDDQTGRDVVLEIRWQGYALQHRLHSPPNRPLAPFEAFTVPLGDLAETMKPRRGQVRFEEDEGRLAVSWTDRGVPRRIHLLLTGPSASQATPAMPDHTATFDAKLTAAYRDAASVTSKDSVRYALQCVQLDGDRSRLGATDGAQAYVHDGFTWPWDDTLLIPATAPLGHRELPGGSVKVGRTTVAGDDGVATPKSDHVVLQTGRWTFWAPVQHGRFPDLHRIIPTEPADSRLALDHRDATFLAEAIDGLPGDEQDSVTIRLDSRVVVRARSGDERADLRLARSRSLGTPARITMRRAFLKRAAELRFDEIGFHGDGRPAVCRDASRHYLWMPLGSDRVEPASQSSQQATSHRVSVSSEATVSTTG